MAGRTVASSLVVYAAGMFTPLFAGNRMHCWVIVNARARRAPFYSTLFVTSKLHLDAFDLRLRASR